MAKSDKTATSSLAHFPALSALEQYAIRLRHDGKSYVDIGEALKEKWPDDARSKDTIRGWFGPDGKLEQAFREYQEEVADDALREAKAIARRLSKTAILTIGELMGSAHNDSIRLGASVAMANKYVPDKQVIIDGGHDSNLPEGVKSRLDGIASKDTADAEEDEPGHSGADDSDAGGGLSESGERPSEG